ncbi:hypothetical protein [Verrucosispora sp. TAA-831]|uniref:hypothetical protein n=1 Tax=Verrucosispora sp. TAA-831 TaxID=3422227 RepID=UPI003D6F04A9
MFERFLSSFPADGRGALEPYWEAKLEGVAGYRELARMGSGRSFGSGIMRVHSSEEALRARGLVLHVFPGYVDIVPIAKDWLGRQFALDFAGVDPQSPRLLLFEPGSAEVFDVECGIEQLFDMEIVDDPVTFLASDLFSEWLDGGYSVPQGWQCVGFKVPLFLGGAGSLENLEVGDEEVYWSIMGQLKSGSA